METTREDLLHSLAMWIADERVLDAIARVPRDLFVDPSDRDLAWENTALPIAAGQTMSQPLIVARMCEELDLRGDEHVLDVGTGSGYHAAVLACLGRDVVTIERHADLSRKAGRALDAAGIANVTLVVGDGTQGYAPLAPYDAVNVAATARGGLPEALTEQLAPHGRLVAPVDGEIQRLVLMRRTNGTIRQTELEGVRFVPLVPNAPRRRYNASQEISTMRIPVTFAAGAAAAFFLDPARGKGRRAQLRDRGGAMARRTFRRAQRMRRRVAADATGAYLHATHRHEAEKPQPNDPTLAQKVQTVLFRDPAMPHGDIVVNAEHGRVALRGTVADRRLIEQIERTVREVRGVQDVENLLHVRGEPAPVHTAAADAPARPAAAEPRLP